MTGNIRPWAWTTVSDRPAQNFLVEEKIRAGSFCPVHKRACSSLGGHDRGTNGTRRLTTATGRVRKVFVFEAGCRRIWGGPVPARHVYSRFKDVSETVLIHRPATLTHSYTVLRRSTDGQSRLWDARWRLSRGQGTLANGCRMLTYGCGMVIIWSCRVFKNRV